MAYQVAETAVRKWWSTYEEHRPQNGKCPVCGVPKCQPRADALTDLIVTDKFHLGPQSHQEEMALK